MNSFIQKTTEIVTENAEHVIGNVPLSAAMVLIFAGFEPTVEFEPLQEGSSLSWKKTAHYSIEKAASVCIQVGDEIGEMLKEGLLKRTPSEYDELHLGAFGTAVRYLTTLSSDPPEAWVRKRHITKLDAARSYGRDLNV